MGRSRRGWAAAGLAGLALWWSPAGAAEDGVTGALLNVPVSVRQMGMGNVSVGGGDLLRAWSNPALLMEQAGKGELSLNGGALFMETRMFGLGGGMKVNENLALGALLNTYALAFDFVDANGLYTGDELSRSFVVGGLAGATAAGPVRLGMTLKFFSENYELTGVNGGSQSDSGPALDFGAAVVPAAGLMVGLAARNVGPGVRATEVTDPFTGAGTGEETKEQLPVEVRGGASYRLEPARLRFGLEFSKAAGVDAVLGAGAEWWANEMFGFRLGATGLGPEAGGQFTAGVSAMTEQVALDFALATHEVDPTVKVNFSYMFGKGERKARPVRQAKPVVVAEAEAAAEGGPLEDVAPVGDGEMLNVAVTDFQGQNVSAGDAAVIADMLRNELIKTGVYNIVEKQSMDKVLAEQAFQQTGCTSEECAVKLGKLLNVQRIVMGSFGQLMGKYFVNVRVINVETGKIVFGDSAKGKSVEDIEQGIMRLSRSMANKVR